MHLLRSHGQRRLVQLLCSLVAALLVMVPAAAAQAHDVLASATPADGSTLATAPAKVELTFDHTPIAIGSGIQVTDSTGTNQADGPVVIVDNHVSQPLRTGAPAGRYTVIWRVVSSDAHPIDGTFTFTVAGAGTGGPAITGSAAPAATSVAAGGGTDRSFTGIPAGVITGAAITVALVVLLAFFTRRRLRRADAGS